jgi:hypothetical protein
VKRPVGARRRAVSQCPRRQPSRKDYSAIYKPILDTTQSSNDMYVN